MCREAIPLAGRFRPREVLQEGTRIAQVIYLQFLRRVWHLNRLTVIHCLLSQFPSLISLAMAEPMMRTAPIAPFILNGSFRKRTENSSAATGSI